MSLLSDKIREYQALLDKKEAIADAEKENNKAIKELVDTISQIMVDEDCPKIGVGDYTYSLNVKTKYSKKGEEKLMAAGVNFLDVLRQQGYGDLIKETVNAQSLQSAMKECAQQNGGELPEELLEVISVYDENDIKRTKSRSRSLQKAKKNREA